MGKELQEILDSMTCSEPSLVSPQKSIPLSFSLQALSASDLASIAPESLHQSTRESFLHSLSRDNTQLLINAILDLPRTSNQEGTFSQLPDPDYALFPRAKPIPKPKPPTRWEAFAKKRGIQNKKRSRKVFDEASGEYKPRFGHGSKNVEEDWIIEVPKNADPNEDLFEKKRNEKKERVAKNAARQRRNQEERATGGAATTPAVAKALQKQAVEKRLTETKTSTASLGRFDKRLHNEDKVKLKRTQKRKFEDNTGDAVKEKQAAIDIATKVLNKSTEKVLNVNKAMKQMQSRPPTSRHLKKARK